MLCIEQLLLLLTLCLIQARPEQMAMDVDGDEDGTQRAAAVLNYGVEVDFSILEEDELDVSSDALNPTTRWLVLILGAIRMVLRNKGNCYWLILPRL